MTTFALLTPDCLRSGLAHSVTCQLGAMLQSPPQYAFRCVLTEGDVRQLYAHLFAQGDAVGRASGASGNLVLSLFRWGPSEVLVWPAELHQRLLEAKGATHPFDAAPSSIRGGYPIDSAVCNLLHVSDDPAAATRELRILKDAPSAPHERVAGSRTGCLPVSGALALCDQLGLATPLQPAERMPAHPAFIGAADILIASQRQELGLSTVVNRYFRGDPQPALDWEVQCELTPWTAFVLRCGAASAAGWRSVLLERVIAYLRERFIAAGISHWVIGGSAASRHHGEPVLPNDIDVRCSEAALEAICRLFDVRPSIENCVHYRSLSATIELGGWSVDICGDLAFEDGRRVIVDEDMVSRRDTLGYQGREDLLAEIISLRRPAPKSDLVRARKLMTRWSSLDQEYLTDRLARQGESPASIAWGPR